MIVERRGGHVVVYLLAALFRGIAGDVVFEGGGVAVKVEGEFCEVEGGVFLKIRAEEGGSCVFEGCCGRYLVAGTDVGVGQFIIGYLPQGIAAVGYFGEVVDGAAVVFEGVVNRTGVEEVRGSFRGLGQVLAAEVFHRLFIEAKHKVGFAENTGQPALALCRDGIHHCGGVLGHVFVFLVHEAALHHVVLAERLEALVGCT